MRFLRLGVVCTVLAVLAAACGGGSDEASPEVAAGDGSETVEVTEGSDGADGETEGAAGGSSQAVPANPDEGVTEDSIRFGWMGALTGLSSSTLEPRNAGTRAYFAYVNEQGGVLDRELELVSYDDAGEIETGITNFRRLIGDDRVLAVIGQSGTHITNALITDIEQAQIPMIGPSATTDPQLEVEYFWNTFPHYADQADVAIEFAAQQVGGIENLNAVTVSLEVPSGAEWQGYVENKVTAAGGTYAEHFNQALGATDAVSIATSLQSLVDADEANYIFFHGNSESALLLMGDLDRFGVDIPIVGIYGIGATKTFTDGPPSLVEQVAFVHSFTPPQISTPGTDEMSDFVAGTEWESYVEDNNVHFTSGWVDAMVAVEAIQIAAESGELSRASLQEALGTIDSFDTQGLSSTIDFTRTGHNGNAVARPYTWDGETLQAGGDYADYIDTIQGEYFLASNS